MRKKVFICSPFRGDMEVNARKAAGLRGLAGMEWNGAVDMAEKDAAVSEMRWRKCLSMQFYTRIIRKMSQ